MNIGVLTLHELWTLQHLGNLVFYKKKPRKEKRRNVDFSGINVIEMPIRPTQSISRL